jgi:methyl-accepting chemotaxis protein
MSDTHLAATNLGARLFTLSVRKRIFGGFAVVLALLVALAAVALHSMTLIGTEAARVSQDSAQATAATDVALQVAEVRARVVQYALSASLDDQALAQNSLTGLDQAIEHSRGSGTAEGGTAGGASLQTLATGYRATVNATITAIEARRSSIENLQVAGTELRTIVSAMVQLAQRETDPAVLGAVARVTESFGASDAAASRFIASRTPAEANVAATAVQALRTSIDALTGVAGDNRRIQRFIKGMADPLDRFTKGLQLVVAADERLRSATAERDAATSAALGVAANQRNQAVQSQTVAVAAMLAGAADGYRLSLATSVGAVGAGLVLAYLIGRGIARPVNRLTGVMRGLVAGDLAIAVPDTTRGDELGEMARAVLVFKEHMQRELQLAAEGEAEHQQAATDKRAALTGMAETIETETGSALRQIGTRTTAMAAIADAMTASAARTGASAENAAAAAAQALANVQTVASAAEQLAASIREIGTQVNQSTAVVGRAVTAGAETRTTIDALNQEVERIGAVADMIGDIAAKTNLLALNATIEAARAGDAGKGFAVVASEVKSLATQTARSTEEIATHIRQVRAATSASVGAVARIEQTITEINAISESIAAAVEQQGAATAEIARSVSETANAANEMTSRTNDVSTEAIDTGQHAAEVRENTAALDLEVDNLRHTVIRVVRTSTTEVDRRLTRRYPVDIAARVNVAGRGEQPVRISDLSEGGACLRGASEVTPGTCGSLRLDGVAAALPWVALTTDSYGLHLSFQLDPTAAAAIRPVLERFALRPAA